MTDLQQRTQPERRLQKAFSGGSANTLIIAYPAPASTHFPENRRGNPAFSASFPTSSPLPSPPFGGIHHKVFNMPGKMHINSAGISTASRKFDGFSRPQSRAAVGRPEGSFMDFAQNPPPYPPPSVEIYGFCGRLGDGMGPCRDKRVCWDASFDAIFPFIPGIPSPGLAGAPAGPILPAGGAPCR